MNNVTKKDMEEGLRTINSMISKTEKAQKN